MIKCKVCDTDFWPEDPQDIICLACDVEQEELDTHYDEMFEDYCDSHYTGMDQDDEY